MVMFLVTWAGFEKWIEGNRREQEEREREAEVEVVMVV